jgi:hypothetical protein
MDQEFRSITAIPKSEGKKWTSVQMTDTWVDKLLFKRSEEGNVEVGHFPNAGDLTKYIALHGSLETQFDSSEIKHYWLMDYTDYYIGSISTHS